MLSVTRICRGLMAVATAVCLTSAAAGAQAGAIGTGGIKGFVHDSGGLGIVGVEITIQGSVNRYETDETGKFELAKVPPGPMSLRFRRLGFRPDTVELQIMAGQTIPFEIRIDRLAIALAPVVVYGRGELTGWKAGFYHRRDRGNGHFYTRDEIESRNPAMTTDLFRTIPGARVVSTPGGFQRFIRFRGNRAGCAPLTWLDGSPLGAGEFDLDAISPRSIEAMEIYAGPATVPSQFVSVRGVNSSCGVIVIWTREPPPAIRKRKSAASVASEIAKLVEAKRLFTAAEVDQPARQDAMRPLRPTYPDQLFDAGTRGVVMAEFVVDATGQVNLDTFSAVYSTHPAFTQAVQNVLRDATYIPAVKAGYPVMQVVQHEFRFVPDSTRKVARP